MGEEYDFGDTNAPLGTRKEQKRPIAGFGVKRRGIDEHHKDKDIVRDLINLETGGGL